mmetsp:Transcript_13042/g.33485  ORF Transcript_13042/g.33485 Transcript_13042/m.33485 type:complete len:245 (-) Transcript_13042:2760-3494(-)
MTHHIWGLVPAQLATEVWSRNFPTASSHSLPCIGISLLILAGSTSIMIAIRSHSEGSARVAAHRKTGSNAASPNAAAHLLEVPYPGSTQDCVQQSEGSLHVPVPEVDAPEATWTTQFHRGSMRLFQKRASNTPSALESHPNSGTCLARSTSENSSSSRAVTSAALSPHDLPTAASLTLPNAPEMLNVLVEGTQHWDHRSASLQQGSLVLLGSTHARIPLMVACAVLVEYSSSRRCWQPAQPSSL